VSRIARTLGYTRPTVRKYLRAAEQVGLRRGERRYREPEWERLARAALAEVAHAREPDNMPIGRSIVTCDGSPPRAWGQ